MEYRPCYDGVTEMVYKASEQFGTKYAVNKEKFSRLRNICEIIDELMPEIEAEALDISVDENSKRFTICIECPEMVLEDGRTSDFFRLIKMIDSFSFRKVRKDTMRIDFNIFGMWECD